MYGQISSFRVVLHTGLFYIIFSSNFSLKTRGRSDQVSKDMFISNRTEANYAAPVYRYLNLVRKLGNLKNLFLLGFVVTFLFIKIKHFISAS